MTTAHSQTSAPDNEPPPTEDYLAYFCFYREKIIQGLCAHFRIQRADAEDAVQEAFIAAHPHWSSAHNGENPCGYLYRTAYRRVIDMWRRRRREQLVEPTMLNQHAPSEIDLGLETRYLRQADIHDYFKPLLDAMPEKQAKIAYLTFIHDLSPEMIAERLGNATGTIKGQQHRIRARIREQLEGGSES